MITHLVDARKHHGSPIEHQSCRMLLIGWTLRDVSRASVTEGGGRGRAQGGCFRVCRTEKRRIARWSCLCRWGSRALIPDSPL